MQTKLIPLHQKDERGKRAEEILRSCVHCGFCNATCPTYQILGDELDGPRGRIYQIKQLLEGGEVSEHTREHLDRCLTCRSCETTCPSGVQYHELVEYGKQALEQALPRRGSVFWKRRLVHAWLVRPALFRMSMVLGRFFRPLLPSFLKAKLPSKRNVELDLKCPNLKVQQANSGSILVFGACIQDAVTPQINEATKIVFESLGYQVSFVEKGVCCGALSQHTDQAALAKEKARRNIDDWLAEVDLSGASAIIANASGCGVFIKDYPELFDPNDPYHTKARELSNLCKDPIELLNSPENTIRLKASMGDIEEQRVAYHPPCTLQHGQKLPGAVEQFFSGLDFTLLLPDDAHLCCGSAGTYSLLQPELSTKLRDNKLERLSSLEPEIIVSANVGCQAHLAGQSAVPVVHWLQFLAQMLTNKTKL